jgi:hypothetical protein
LYGRHKLRPLLKTGKQNQSWGDAPRERVKALRCEENTIF